MSAYNKAQAPYYDDYDSSKQYTHLLAIPGRVAQAREITQIQSVVKDIVKSLGDSILKDGNIIEGCQVVVNNSKTAVTVTAGKVYIEGMVLPLKETTVPIRGTGEELVGVKLVETIITEIEDPSLRDPAQGYDNYSQPGCHRLKSEISVVIDDEDAATLVRLVDGAIAVEQYAPEYDVMTQTLARRTYDESGSYLVNGLEVRVEKNANDTSKFNVVIESGKAYVLGYELKVPAARRIIIPRSTESVSVSVSNYIFSDDIDIYQLDSAPYVKEIISVVGDIRQSIETSISTNTDSVTLGEGVSEIESVTQGEETYIRGTDYSLERISGAGNQYALKWNGTDHYPVLNSSFTIVFRQRHTFIKGTDYELYHNTVDDSHNIRWISGGITPLASTYFEVNYNQYLARKDTVYMDKYGNIDVILGNPAEYGFESLPDAPVNTLALAYIMSPPGGSVSTNENIAISVSNIGLTRFTMNDIHDIVNRIKTIEYDQAVISLNNEAKEYDTSSAKRGIFTDPLIDLSKIDFYYNMNNRVVVDSSKPFFDVNIDLDDNLCCLPIISSSYSPRYSDSSTSKLYTRNITLNKTGERVVLSQMNATKSFLINPYSLYPQLPEIYTDPAVDTWYEENVIEVPVSRNTSEVVSTTTRNVTTSAWAWTSSTSLANTNYVTGSSTSTTNIGTRVDNSTTYAVIGETPTTYIRQKLVTVTGSHFPPNLDRIKCYFDGVEAPLTPVGATREGSISGSVMSDSSGYLKAYFTIPSNIKTGTREVRLKSDILVDGYENSAFTFYTATGTVRNIQKTVTTLTTILLQRVITVELGTYRLDPIGQTFVLDDMTVLSGIDLYFENKPTDGTPITCEIREVSNGMITPNIYAHSTLSSHDVTISSDSTKATRFNFDDPVILEENKEYAFIVRSTSTLYRAWIAELGENDILSGNRVLSNPYLLGVMMSSSNNSSWTSHQTSDLKFRLISDVYNNNAEVIFDEITKEEGFSRIFLNADAVIPDGTSVNWLYSLDGGDKYYSISPYNMVVLNQMKNSIKFKAKLSRSNLTSLTPILATDAVALSLSSYDLSGYYITKNISGLDEYTNIDIILDTYTPNNNTGIEVYLSTDNGVTLTSVPLIPAETRALNYGWREQVFRATVSKSTQCKIFIKLTSAVHQSTPAFRRLRAIMS